VADSSVPVVIEVVYVALRTYFLTLGSEPKLTSPDAVHEAVRVLNFGKASCPNDIPHRDLKHLHQRAVSLLAQIFNTVLFTHHFPCGSTLGWPLSLNLERI
jgi:hypothetical protein